MLMETEANAKARGAPVYCEVAGFGSAYGVELDEQLGLGAMPTADAVAAAITSALEVAGVKPEEVGFVSAHGTGVPAADAAELAGIKKAFGAHAGKLLVSSTRAQLGNAMAANSGLDALVCAKALRDGVVPGTARLEQARPPPPSPY
jgi:3-oxoacyl-[acyl-carrier-protein] synthase II